MTKDRNKNDDWRIARNKRRNARQKRERAVKGQLSAPLTVEHVKRTPYGILLKPGEIYVFSQDLRLMPGTDLGDRDLFDALKQVRVIPAESPFRVNNIDRPVGGGNATFEVTSFDGYVGWIAERAMYGGEVFRVIRPPREYRERFSRPRRAA